MLHPSPIDDCGTATVACHPCPCSSSPLFGVAQMCLSYFVLPVRSLVGTHPPKLSSCYHGWAAARPSFSSHAIGPVADTPPGTEDGGSETVRARWGLPLGAAGGSRKRRTLTLAPPRRSTSPTETFTPQARGGWKPPGSAAAALLRGMGRHRRRRRQPRPVCERHGPI